MFFYVSCLKVFGCCTELDVELSMVNHTEVVHVLECELP